MNLALKMDLLILVIHRVGLHNVRITHINVIPNSSSIKSLHRITNTVVVRQVTKGISAPYR